MKRFGLIGFPISHSLSPALFRAGYREKWGRDYYYDLIRGDDFGASYGKFIGCYDGINVTAPFKEKAFSHADAAEPGCAEIGAANLLLKTGNGIYAYNTDYYGVRMCIGKAMHDLGMTGKASSALVVGCGGAGKAAAAAASGLCRETIIVNRSREKAEAFAQRLKDREITILGMEDFRDCFRKAEIVIHTLPAVPDILDGLAPEDFASGGERPHGKIILEANYRDPQFPGLLKKIAQNENRHTCLPEYIPGTEWLLQQAVAGFEIFTGEHPDEDAMAEVAGQARALPV